MNLDVPDAIWFSSVFPGLQEIPAGKYSPSEIRRWFNKQQKALAAAAMWFATEFRTPYENLPADLTHPKHIRVWFANDFRGSHEKLPVGMGHPKEIRRWFNEQQAVPDAIWFASFSPTVGEIPAGPHEPYELIEVANGTKSMAAFREEATERKREQRRKETDGLRDVTQSDAPQSNQELSATKSPKSERKRAYFCRNFV